MHITRLIVQNCRNISYLDINPSSSFNLIYGPNGSGKTSLLESISYLGLGRSFRTSKYLSLIRKGTESITISAKVKADKSEFEDTLGISRFKSRSKGMMVSVNSEHSSRLLDLVDRISVQVIHPQGIDLILGSPELRRSYIDWGIYYLYPEFKQLWMNYKKLLSQRNFLLKKNASVEEIQLWDDALSSISENITSIREEYLQKLYPILREKLQQFLPDFEFDFNFQKGWENGLQLRSALDFNLEKDRILGYTFYGCHRADLRVKCNGFLASDTLSRGQLKLLVCAMRLSQSLLLRQQSGNNCIFLIDDLNSELDPHSRHLLLDDLIDCRCQVFLTNISEQIDIPDHIECKYINIATSITPDS